ncbi:MAG: cupin [Proteobacteria bacterium]|nr:cupin [Pseudomonadota bacterium]MDA1308530.1 cupin [Pseudomonadota bacterium]
MAPGKVNLDFHGIDTAGGFVTRPDNPLIHEKILGSTLDTTNRTGVRTRLLRLDAGCRTPEAHAHPYWEELYLIEGDLVSIDAAGERVHTAPGYASRTPGSMHGPVRTDGGCLLLEFNWYEAEDLSTRE